MTPERNPREAFDRLFSNRIRGEVATNRAARDFYNKSILDFVTEDTRNLSRYLGRTDQGKLDAYLDTVREIEKRIETAEKFALQTPDMDRPLGSQMIIGNTCASCMTSWRSPSRQTQHESARSIHPMMATIGPSMKWV